MHYIFSVEGNIGSGKSTLVKMLKDALKKIKSSIGNSFNQIVKTILNRKLTYLNNA